MINALAGATIAIAFCGVFMVTLLTHDAAWAMAFVVLAGLTFWTLYVVRRPFP